MAATKWAEAMQPLLKKQKGKRHPLDYQNNYQLLVTRALQTGNCNI